MANEYSMMATIKCKHINEKFLDFYKEDISDSLKERGFEQKVIRYYEHADSNYLGNLAVLFITLGQKNEFCSTYAKAYRSFIQDIKYDNNELVIYFRSADSGQEYFRALYDNFSDSIESISITISNDVDEEELELMKYMFGEDFSISIGNKQYNSSAAPLIENNGSDNKLEEFGDWQSEDNCIVNKFSMELSNDNSQNEDSLIKEMFLNFSTNHLEITHAKTVADSTVTEPAEDSVVDEILDFDGNDSTTFSKIRKNAFIERYGLKKLFPHFDRDSVESYMAPNGAIVYFFRVMNDEILQIAGRNVSTLHEILVLLANKNYKVDIEAVLERIFSKNRLFPSPTNSVTLNWEVIQDILYPIEDTKENAPYKQFVDAEVDKLKKQSMKTRAPFVGDFVHRINIVGDRSYHDNILRVDSVQETYVTLVAKDSTTVYTIHTSLSDFWHNFEEVSVDEFIDLVKKAFKYLLDDELFNGLMTHQFIEREPEVTTVTVGALNDARIVTQADIIYMIYYEVFDNIEAQLSTCDSMDTEFQREAVGTIFDLPLILNYMNKGDYYVPTRVLGEKFEQYSRYKDAIFDAIRVLVTGVPALDELEKLVTERFSKLEEEYKWGSEGSSVSTMNLFN